MFLITKQFGLLSSRKIQDISILRFFVSNKDTTSSVIRYPQKSSQKTVSRATATAGPIDTKSFSSPGTETRPIIAPDNRIQLHIFRRFPKKQQHYQVFVYLPLFIQHSNDDRKAPLTPINRVPMVGITTMNTDVMVGQ